MSENKTIADFMRNESTVSEEYNPADAFMDQSKELKTRLVSIYEIAFNPLNDQGDTLEELQEFAEVIHEEGQVRSPLNVYKKIQSNGKKYMLLGGDRRLHALLLNAEKYPDSQKMVSIVIEPKPKDEVEEELKILELNEHRALSAEREKKLVNRYLRLYRELENRKQKPEGQIRKWIANRMNIGEKKAEKYIHELEGYKKPRKEKKIETRKDHMLKSISGILEYELKRNIKVDEKYKVTIKCTSKEDLYNLLCDLGFDDVVECVEKELNENYPQ